jgi:hypothetical protein
MPNHIDSYQFQYIGKFSNQIYSDKSIHLAIIVLNLQEL